MYLLDDNIVALATSPKASTINIVRCSGPSVLNIFTKLTKQKKLPGGNTVNVYLITCPKTNNIIDQSLVSVFNAPKSYTGEDMIEFSTHGGIIVCKKIVNAILSAGCRLAEPGEFTYRAFINGKIDLIQAESINTLITTENNIESSLSLSSLSGGLSKRIKEVEKKLINIITILEHQLDFSDDDVTEEDVNHYILSVKKINIEVEDIMNKSLLIGEKNTQTKLCLAGKPNVGKSSLFNLLIGYDRAIVNKRAGTTRDTITAIHSIKNTETELIDTAGIRKTVDPIEKAGVTRSINAIKESDLVIFVDDTNPKLEWKKLNIKKNNVIFVQNKIDIKKYKKIKNIFYISCKTKEGINVLLTHLLTYYDNLENKYNNLFLLNSRQKNSLSGFQKQTSAALQSHSQTKDLSIFITSLYSSLRVLGQLRGSKKDMNIINKIFKGFCVGK